MKASNSLSAAAGPVTPAQTTSLPKPQPGWGHEGERAPQVVMSELKTLYNHEKIMCIMQAHLNA